MKIRGAKTRGIKTLRLSGHFIVFILGFLWAAPAARACHFGLETTLFFNVVPRQLLEADVIAEVSFVNVNAGAPGGDGATVNVERLIKTSNPRALPGETMVIKYGESSCGPFHRSGDKGLIIAEAGSDGEGRPVLCPYSRKEYNQLRFEPPRARECLSVDASNKIRDEEFKRLKRAAESGNADAQNRLGRWYMDDHNCKEALKWLELSAARGKTESMVEIGALYERGCEGEGGFDHNYTKMMEWKRIAAEKRNAKRNAKAWFELGREYWGKFNGERSLENFNEALKFLELAAAQGNVGAMYILGRMYLDEGPVYPVYNPHKYDGEAYSPRDGAKAAEWYARAAERGDTRAQNELGRMYLNGKGVKKDDAEALKWFRLAAAQGDRSAVGQLKEMYEQGRGATKDDADEANWYISYDNLLLEYYKSRGGQ